MYKLYSIESYGNSGKLRTDKEYKEYNLNDLLIELEKHKKYHMDILKDNNYIFFGDCDNFRGTFKEFAEMLIDFLETHYEIETTMDDISYTENKAKVGSFHCSIPKIYGSCNKLKELFA